MTLTVHDSTAATGIVKVTGAAGTGRPPEWEPRPFPQSWWQTRQSREALTGRLLGLLTDPAAGRARDKTRRRGLTKLLDWLQRQPGDTWQEKWLASGADAAGSDWTDLPLKDRVPAREHHRDELRTGLVPLVAGQVLRPGYRWLLRQRQTLMLAEARAAIDPGGFRNRDLYRADLGRGHRAHAGPPRAAAHPAGQATRPAGARLPAGGPGGAVRHLGHRREEPVTLTVHDSTAATGIVKVTGAAGTGLLLEWEPRPFPQSWWQTRQSREALTGRLLGLLDRPGGGPRPGQDTAARPDQAPGLAAAPARGHLAGEVAGQRSGRRRVRLGRSAAEGSCPGPASIIATSCAPGWSRWWPARCSGPATGGCCGSARR